MKNNGKYQNGKKHTSRKPLAILLALILLVGGVVGGTLAWLTAQTPEVENVFTTSDIGVTLTETKKDFKMIPGWTIEKDPIVTVTKGSEDSWVFVKVTESANLKDFITYEIDSNNWTQLTDDQDNPVAGVYYIKYTQNNDKNITIKVLKDNQVTVNDTVTEKMMGELKMGNEVQPTLTFTAYATQYWKNNDTPFTPAEAWAVLNPTTTP